MSDAVIEVKLQLLDNENQRESTLLSRKLDEDTLMQIFHNPQCSKSRQTLQLIVDAGQEVEVIEYLQNPPTVEELRRVVGLLGRAASVLVRKSEAVFQELDVDLATLSDDAVIDLIVANPILMQRPIVVGQGKAIIGRPPENVMQLLS